LTVTVAGRPAHLVEGTTLAEAAARFGLHPRAAISSTWTGGCCARLLYQASSLSTVDARLQGCGLAAYIEARKVKKARVSLVYSTDEPDILAVIPTTRPATEDRPRRFTDPLSGRTYRSAARCR
jgi:hypothetical protein